MTETLYAFAGGILFAMALYAVFARRNLLRKVIAANIAASGAFLLLVAASGGEVGGAADPVPQALVLTGIVISVSVTAVALALLRRLFELGNKPYFPEDEDR